MDEVSRLREREKAVLIGICTTDFSSLHDITKTLREKHVPIAILEPGAVWETMMDCLILERGLEEPVFTLKDPPVVFLTADPAITVDRAVAASLDRKEIRELVAGVDPGSRPGIAFIADGTLISAVRARDPSEIKGMMMHARKAYKPGEMLVRVGDGDPAQGRVIVSQLREASFRVELTNEAQTTRTRRYRDENAAVLIARTKGVPA